MSQKRIEITVPEEMVPFVLLSDGEAQLKRNASSKSDRIGCRRK